MARFIHPKIISAAVARLGKSRASRSVLNFLVFKRASILERGTIVSFSANNSGLSAAVDDLAACAQNQTPLPSYCFTRSELTSSGT